MRNGFGRTSLRVTARGDANQTPSFRDVGAGPESILTIVVMDSGLARFAPAPEWRLSSGLPRRAGDDFLQGRHMAGESAAPGGG